VLDFSMQVTEKGL